MSIQFDIAKQIIAETCPNRKLKLENVVSAFKKHQLQYGLNGYSGLKELYKWELVTKQLGHPDTDAV